MIKNKKIEDFLANLGLSENETKVYLSMLCLGRATVLQISKSSEVPRTTVYSIIEKLNQKGLTRTEVQGFKKKYVAESPERLEAMLEQRKHDLDTLLPEFEALYKLEGGESFIKYYEGSEAIKNAHFEMLKKLNYNDSFLVIGDPDKWERVNQSFGEKFVKERNKIKLQIRMLLVESETGSKYQSFEKEFGESIKLLPRDTEIETNVAITPKMLSIQQMVEPYVLVTIENKSIIHLHQQLFDVMWNAKY